jgi:IS5 family transposase
MPPEVDCIGKGKASAPYEFGVKASIVTTNARAPGGQFVLHAKALPGNPYNGHTLGGVIDATERLTGCAIERAYVDKGYRGHDNANPRRSAVSSASSSASCAAALSSRRLSAHKDRRTSRRCHFNGPEGDTANVVLTAVGRLAEHSAAPIPDHSVADFRRPARTQMCFLTGVDGLKCGVYN